MRKWFIDRVFFNTLHSFFSFNCMIHVFSALHWKIQSSDYFYSSSKLDLSLRLLNFSEMHASDRMSHLISITSMITILGVLNFCSLLIIFSLRCTFFYIVKKNYPFLMRFKRISGQRRGTFNKNVIICHISMNLNRKNAMSATKLLCINDKCFIFSHYLSYLLVFHAF